eukprot:TRINITY_DN6343_c0_g1_i2.p1 TRINITY_DN6343_c0_g1~~TRINITY_DN6343_c0_g1_i2.p1  ORF type:complete len:892 (+),score=202.62 TRINITY_DN6343_c0_g1_i2:78-2753(+)
MRELVVLMILMLGGSGVLGLYEDQAYKFDWRKQLIGKVEDLEFLAAGVDTAILVRTQKNVLAALDSDDGKLLWRHKFEDSAETGKILAIGRLNRNVVSVSGSSNIFLRLWEPLHGALVQEHFIKLASAPTHAHLVDNNLHFVFVKPNGMDIVTYTFDTKKFTEGSHKKVSTETTEVEKCVGLDNLLVCSTPSGLIYTQINSKEPSKAEMIPVADIQGSTLARRGTRIQVENSAGSVSTFKVENGKLVKQADITNIVSECPGVEVKQECSEWGTDSEGNKYCAQYADNILTRFKGEETTVKLASYRGKLEAVWSECGADPQAYQLILAFQDGGLVSVTPRGNIMFTREEGLTSVHKAEFVNIGFEDKSSTFGPLYLHHENMFDPATLAQNFINRMKRHILQLREFISSLIQLKFLEKNSAATLDRFGLNKMIVIATEHNKLYGMESISGKLMWQLYFPGRFTSAEGFESKSQAYLLIQRDGRAGGEAQAVLIYAHAHSVHHMMTFDPLTGKMISNEPLNMHLDQALLLPEFSDHEIKPILLVGKDGNVAVHPRAAAECLRSGPPLFVLSGPTNSKLVGSKVVPSQEGSGVSLVPVWSLVTPSTEIVSVKTRNPIERVHSAGRVLADRSVLFKYMNPNLALVAAQGTDSSAKLFLNIYLLDMVTGKVHYSATHKKVLGPYHTVHSENWAVYSFYNEKARRAELVSLEMYEGKTQTNATVFSSIENKVIPLVERQAYILPVSDVRALKETVTEQGITSKHLLIGSAVGNVLDLPLHLVDPRRPPLDTPAGMREPGIPPYIPELPMPHESIMNYNQTILGMKDILTSPSGLESTTLVFVHGLDLYGTRITPSKGFDLLKEDFDYIMISAVILGLVLASYITRKLAQKKMLTKAWK